MTISLNTLIRAVSAPPHLNMAKYGANYLNDDGYSFLHFLGCMCLVLFPPAGVYAVCYEASHQQEFDLREQEVAELMKKTYEALAAAEAQDGDTTITIDCTLDNQSRKLWIAQNENGVLIGSDDLKVKPKLFENMTFASFAEKLEGQFGKPATENQASLTSIRPATIRDPETFAAPDSPISEGRRWDSASFNWRGSSIISEGSRHLNLSEEDGSY